MKLFEMKGTFGSLPTKAGKATLDWKNIGSPARDGQIIHLPSGKDNEMFPLKQGEQFLFAYNAPGEGHRLYFGGTDEEPFLVRLGFSVLETLEGGERGFYDALKPDPVKRLENKFGAQTKRQGDWFCVELPGLDWRAVEMFLALDQRGRPAPKESGKRGLPIGRTRHQIIGLLLDLGSGGPLFAEGTLVAPDHADLKLTGPHALFQAQKLDDPQNAD